ncbi:hypothetical protein JAAARDRAFT_122825 [Jaapia argillacea MUCL 33604]|uniref:DDE Tnp4 domain-containing protein n=1 Tax=Jaapia argillacea MUCL 33604 TaxID=933084 RepID=A0A067Q631_9AGAM|nr:hypothetical protein JAAARDRAFT_122825 [Jaapia argillacea MUCL 33604]
MSWLLCLPDCAGNVCTSLQDALEHTSSTVCITPFTFDQLLEELTEDPVFSNNSQNAQLSVETQIAITLYCFGHNSNGISLQQTSHWTGVGKGTVECRRKQRCGLRGHSCKAWHGGWCLINRTLISLFDKPYWFGESYFGWKSNYSLSFQIVSLPNLQIIDYRFDFTGSAHDSTAWGETQFAQDHEWILEDDEFIWADSAYLITTWLVSPYKKPERDMPENEEFNRHVPMV